MEIHPSETYNLERLQRWLDYELSSSTLLFFSWFWGFLLGLMLIAAVVFIPFMLKILYEEKKYGWIIYFFVIVVLPAVGAQFINIDIYYKFLLTLIPFALFYFYCFTLKLAVRTWVTESRFKFNDINDDFKADDIFKNYKF